MRLITHYTLYITHHTLHIPHKKGALTHTANTPHNIMYEKKISYSQDEADELSRLHATSPCHAFPEVLDSTSHDNQAENSCQ